MALVSVCGTPNLRRSHLNLSTGSIPFLSFLLPMRQSHQHPLLPMGRPYPTGPVAKRAPALPQYPPRLGPSAHANLSAASAESLYYRWSRPLVKLSRLRRVPLPLSKISDGLPNGRWWCSLSAQRAMDAVFFDLLAFLRAITYQ